MTALNYGKRHLLIVVLIAAAQSPLTTDAFVPNAKRVVSSVPRKYNFDKSKSSSALNLSLEEQLGELASGVLSSNFPSTFVDQVSLESLLHFIPKDEWFAFLSSLQTVPAFPTEFFQNLSGLGQFGLAVSPLFLLASHLAFPPEDYRENLEPYSRGKYDPEQAKAYYKKHPKEVLQRVAQILRLSNGFLTSLMLDKYVLHNEKEMRPQRAKELLTLITQLGPTAIKVGQALSVRHDIVPHEYAEALSTLQDQVRPFPNEEARSIIMRELGPHKFDDLQGIANSNPVASASIGQVYKAKLGNKNVAVKVQRPNVLSDIALDLYIFRELAPLYEKYIAKSNTDLQSVVNEWGRGFIAELDYRQEAAKTIQFNVEMKKRKLDAVFAPEVLKDYSSEQVLVTEWIDGNRIDQSEASDIPRLCSVALNAYLVMLLELQSLHCDPHPGNLLRTPDGRLCILDFGMTLDVDKGLQYSLLEYIAHCSSDNYDMVPEDLVNMGFLRADRLEYIRESGVLEPLIYFLKQAGKGGGATAVRERILSEFRERYPGLNDFEVRKRARQEMEAFMQDSSQRGSVATGIASKVEELQKGHQDSFVIPSWFVYTSRAFMTLEGVSLQVDENYSLMQSCFPYIAKRLVKDDSPRAQKALKEMIYGAGDKVDLERLEKLAGGFSQYTKTTKKLNTVNDTLFAAEDHGQNKKAKLVEAEAAITLARDSADVLLDPKGNFVQKLLVEESVLAASARVKDGMKGAFVDAPKKFRESLPFGVGILLPPLPFEGVVAPFVKKTEAEEKAQKLIEKLSHILQVNGEQNQQSSDGKAIHRLIRDLDPEQAALIVKELRQNLPMYTGLIRQLGTKFVAALLQKASDNIDSTLSEMEAHQRDKLLFAAIKGLSNVAQQGAKTITVSSDTKRDNSKFM